MKVVDNLLSGIVASSSDPSCLDLFTSVDFCFTVLFVNICKLCVHFCLPRENLILQLIGSIFTCYSFFVIMAAHADKDNMTGRTFRPMSELIMTHAFGSSAISLCLCNSRS